MKKHKIIVMLAALLLILMPVPVYAQNETENRFDVWKTSAIISPESGELKASGDIAIAFHHFAITGIEIDHYDIYLDGEKEKTVEETGKQVINTSLYITKTDYYLLQVVAVSNDQFEFSSSIRKFLVSKKGLNVDDEMVKTKIEDMNESWYYNWGYLPSDYVKDNKEFVPMVWGRDSISWLKSDDVNQYSIILGFNEPDLANQANISVSEAVSYQDTFTCTLKRIGSCAVSYPLNQWFDEYMAQIDTDVIDFIPVHIYYDWAGEGMADAFLQAIDTLYEKYRKPIWITEFGISNSGLYGVSSQYDEAFLQLEAYMKDVINGLEQREYVERYTWFNFNENDSNGGKTAIYSQETGKLTELGKLYKSLGNPDIEGIDLQDEYVEDNGYYQDLDDVINQAQEIKNSKQYERYINTLQFENVLNDALQLDRHLGSKQQYIIDRLTVDLQTAIQTLELKQEQSYVTVDDNGQQDEQSTDSVRTGDHTLIELWLIYVICGICGILFVSRIFGKTAKKR